MLGLNAVKNIAIAASMAKLFRGGELGPNFSARDLWTHSNVTAAAAKMIATQMKLGPSDEAFLAGLIHDIGIMVEMQYDRNKLIEVIRKTGLDSKGVPAMDMLAAEQQVFEATHQDFGTGLCETWKFPKSFAYVSGWHHRPMELASENRTLPAVVYIADRLAAETGMGFRGDLLSVTLDPEVLDFLKLTKEAVDSIRNQVKAQAKDMANTRIHPAAGRGPADGGSFSPPRCRCEPPAWALFSRALERVGGGGRGAAPGAGHENTPPRAGVRGTMNVELHG